MRLRMWCARAGPNEAAVLADVDSDDHLDVVTAESGSPGTVAVLLGDGAGAFTWMRRSPPDPTTRGG